MNKGNLALTLVEGTKNDRDKFINNTDVLDKVKKLAMLPDGEHMTATQVSEYFDVSKVTIDQLVRRHKEEIESDGARILKGDDLSKYKTTHLQHVSELKKVGSLKLFNRRSILRIGMLLTCSKVAERIRNYLLDLENLTPQIHKESVAKYNGKWTDDFQTYTVKEINYKLASGKSLYLALREFSKENKIGLSTVTSRWYGTGVYKGKFKPLKDVEVLIEEPIIQTIEDTSYNQSESVNKILDELISLKNANNQLHENMSKLWRGYTEVKESNEMLHNIVSNEICKLNKELQEFKNELKNTYKDDNDMLNRRVSVQSKKLKDKENEILNLKSKFADIMLGENEILDKQSFKMDVNGNLTKVK